MEVNTRIRQCRMDLGMSQEELAEAVGYTGRSAIARIESGRNKVSISKIPIFAKALHTTEAYLLGVDSKKSAEEAVITYAQNSTSDTAKKLRDHLLSAMKLLEAEQREESEVSAKFKRLTPANQTIVMTMIDTMLAQQK
jgi:transcriptional regulator with XRE-family HTH domain